MRRQRVGGGTGRLHAWGKTWRGPENSGVGKSEARIHNSLRSLSQVLVYAYIKLGTQLGFVLSLGTWSHLGVSGTLCKVHAIASTLSCHRTLGKLRQQVCGPEGYRLTRGTGVLGQQGSPLLQHLGEAGPAFPRKGSLVTCYVPGYLHGKVSTLLSRQAFHQQCGGRRPTTFRRQRKRSPNPGSEGRDGPVPGAFAVSCPCGYGQEGSLLGSKKLLRAWG